MSRKHFREVAAQIAESRAPLCERRKLADTFAAMFAKANPRFDRARFLSACGL